MHERKYKETQKDDPDFPNWCDFRLFNFLIYLYMSKRK